MILITGGTGLVGARIVEKLVAAGQPVRVMARGLTDWKTSNVPEFRRRGIDVVTGDIRDQERVAQAMEGCKAVINVAGVQRSLPGASIESINMEAVINLVALAEANNVQRFVQVSCFGASQHADSRYFYSKWQAESIVKGGRFYWTIFRPSLVFGEYCQLLKVLNFWTERGPFIPVIGSGLNRLAPLHADDLADYIIGSLYNRETANQVYDLVGPKSYDLTEVLQLACRNQGMEKPAIKIPAGIGMMLVRFMSKLNPQSPIDEDVVKVLTSELSPDHEPKNRVFSYGTTPFETMFKYIGVKAKDETPGKM